MPTSLGKRKYNDHDVAWRLILRIFVIQAIFSLRRSILACRSRGLDVVPLLTYLLVPLER
jgi:hypothetical protein